MTAPERAPSSGRFSTLQPTALLAFRLLVGALLGLHGWQKGAHPNQFVEYVGSLGVPAPEFAATAVILLEIGLGGLLILGLATRLAGALLVGHMALIWTTVHSGGALVTDGRSGITGELALLYLAAGLGLVATGSGPLGVDSLFGSRNAKPAHSAPHRSTLTHSNGSPKPSRANGTPTRLSGTASMNALPDSIDIGGFSRIAGQRRTAR